MWRKVSSLKDQKIYSRNKEMKLLETLSGFPGKTGISSEQKSLQTTLVSKSFKTEKFISSPQVWCLARSQLCFLSTYIHAPRQRL